MRKKKEDTIQTVLKKKNKRSRSIRKGGVWQSY